MGNELNREEERCLERYLERKKAEAVNVTNSGDRLYKGQCLPRPQALANKKKSLHEKFTRKVYIK